MKRATLLVFAGAIAAGCGGASGESRSSSDASARPRAADPVTTTYNGIEVDGSVAAVDKRVLDAFGFVPDGFEYGTEAAWKDDPRGKPPGTAAAFLHKRDCCEPGDTFHYPPTVMLRKFPDEVTLAQVAQFRIAEARKTPGLVDGSVATSTTRVGGIPWTTITFSTVVPGIEHPQRAKVHLARRDGMTFEFFWLASSMDLHMIDGDLDRMWREVDWQQLPTVDF